MTISDYINEQDEAIRPRLLQVYDAIRTAIPDAEECISWQMPTFRKGRNIIHFAAYKSTSGSTPGLRRWRDSPISSMDIRQARVRSNSLTIRRSRSI